MEILDPSEVEIEQTGRLVDGLRWFPKASPRRMLRIFRTRLKTLSGAIAEIARVKTVERYLAPDFMATSTECIVDYQGPCGRDLLLCGFQEFVPGETLDPWTLLDATDLLPTLYDTLQARDAACTLSKDAWIAAVRRSGAVFIERIKNMIIEAGHVPDLAGVGNLILTCSGGIRLVDINNISPIALDASICLDEKGYPVCDKSVEALALIEEKILGTPVDMHEKLYRLFLNCDRRHAVKAKEKLFWKKK